MEQLQRFAQGVWAGDGLAEGGTGRSDSPWAAALTLLLGSGQWSPRNMVSFHTVRHHRARRPSSHGSAAPGDGCPSAGSLPGRNRNGPLERLSWPSVQKAAAHPGSTVIWPFGNAKRSTAPPPPGKTDALFAERIFEAVLDSLARRPADLASSALQHWFSPEHRGLPWLPSAFLLKTVIAR